MPWSLEKSGFKIFIFRLTLDLVCVTMIFEKENNATKEKPMFEKLTRMLDAFIDNGTHGYDCVVYQDGKCVYRHMNGYSDAERKISVCGDELYYVYSCSKVITVTAAMQLYERGLFDLDDKLEKYIPEYKTMYVKNEQGEPTVAKNPITVRHLFTMTAGFSYALKNPAIKKFKEETRGKCPTREFARYMADSVLDFEPGTRWQYSFCHDILASLVEIWSGEKFGEYVRKNIFEPAKMTNSSFYISPENYHKLAPQYKYDFSDKTIKPEKPTNCYDLGPEFESGGAGCVTTVDDCIRFAEALRVGKLLKDETLDLMSTNQIEHCMDSFWIERYAYGLGVRCSRGGDGITDIGWGGAAGAGIWIDRENKITAFYAQHVLSSPVIKKRNDIIFVIKEILGCGPVFALEGDEETTEKDKMRSSYGV